MMAGPPTHYDCDCCDCSPSVMVRPLPAGSITPFIHGPRGPLDAPRNRPRREQPLPMVTAGASPENWTGPRPGLSSAAAQRAGWTYERAGAGSMGVRTYLFSYRYNGQRYSLEIPANGLPEALDRAEAIRERGLHYDGELVASIPVPGVWIVHRLLEALGIRRMK